MATADLATIDALREFNRLYTRRAGLLDEHLYDTGFTLAEARVLFELSRGERPKAAMLAQALDLDPAYLSRILKKFRAAGLVASAPDPQDGRSATLSLTRDGEAAYAPLLARSRSAAETLIRSLPPERRAQTLAAIDGLRAALDPAESARPAVLREPGPGEVGWVIHRQAAAYAEEYGFNAQFEGLVAEIAGGFLRHQDASCERGWVADRGGALIGSVFLTRGRASGEAQLRLLFVEKSARGAGVGKALLNAATDFARTAGYRSLTLWTNSVLIEARRLYERAGFQLENAEKHRMFGPEMEGQTWRLPL